MGFIFLGGRSARTFIQTVFHTVVDVQIVNLPNLRITIITGDILFSIVEGKLFLGRTEEQKILLKPYVSCSARRDRSHV